MAELQAAVADASVERVELAAAGSPYVLAAELILERKLKDGVEIASGGFAEP